MNPTSYSINTLESFDTVYTADCIDFCPVENYTNIFLVGTYQLESKDEALPQKRIGKLYLFRSDGQSMTKLHEIEMPGILDARWSPFAVKGKVLLAIANAEGELLIYALNDECKLNLLNKTEVCSPGLALYVDWKPFKHSSDITSLVVSDSNGFIHIYNLTDDGCSEIGSTKAHDFEAWVTCFDNENPSLVYTGGDDSKFSGFDFRMEDNINKVFTSKEHNAGVTSILPLKNNQLLTGSYDENLRSWDKRNMRSSVATHSIGGGIWRLRTNPVEENLILASCMHEGFKLIDIQDELKVVSNYDNHQSLAYGADWSRTSNGINNLIASVSFYDHLLCLWTLKKNE